MFDIFYDNIETEKLLDIVSVGKMIKSRRFAEEKKKQVMKKGQRCRCGEAGGFRIAVEIVGSTASAWLWVPRSSGLVTSWLAERLRTALGLREPLLIEARPQFYGARSRLLCPSDPLAVLHQNDTLVVTIVEYASIKELNRITAAVIHLPTEITCDEANIPPPTPMRLEHSVDDAQSNIEDDAPIEDRQNVSLLEINQNQTMKECEQFQPIEDPQNDFVPETNEHYQHVENIDDDLSSVNSDDNLNETLESNNVVEDNENISNILHKHQHKKETVTPEQNSYAKAFKAIHKSYYTTTEILNQDSQDQQEFVNDVSETDGFVHVYGNERVQATNNINNDIHCIKEMEVERASKELSILNVKDSEYDDLSQKREFALKLLNKNFSSFCEETNNFKQVERRRRRRVRRRRRPAPYTQEQPDTTPSTNTTEPTNFTETFSSTEHLESFPLNNKDTLQKLSITPAQMHRKDKIEPQDFTECHPLSPFLENTLSLKFTQSFSRKEKIKSPVESDVSNNTASLPVESEPRANGESSKAILEPSAISEVSNVNASTSIISEVQNRRSPHFPVVRTSHAVPPKARLVRAIL